MQVFLTILFPTQGRFYLLCLLLRMTSFMILIAYLIQIFMQKCVIIHPCKTYNTSPLYNYLLNCLSSDLCLLCTYIFCESSVPCLSPLTRRCAFFMAVSQEPKSLTHSTQYTFVEKLSKEVCTVAFNTHALITRNWVNNYYIQL